MYFLIKTSNLAVCREKLMRKVINFLKDRSGNIAITATIALLPIMASVAAATDWSAFSRQKGYVQQSLDAAALATAKELYSIGDDNDAALEVYAKKFFEGNVEQRININTLTFSFKINHGDTSVEPPVPTTIELAAILDYKTAFAPVLGIDEIEANISSEISVGNRSVEIALVMDNSGSMSSNSRLSIMQSTTKGLVEAIFKAGSFSEIEDPVKFSVVPFAGMVNVGAGNSSASWMDTNGWSSIHHENFNWDTYQTNNNTEYQYLDGTPATAVTGFKEQISGTWEWLTRLDVYDKVGEDWSGCVEMRPWPYNTTDDVASSNLTYNTLQTSFDSVGNPASIGNGADALFVPTFAPDTPDRRYTYQSGGSYYTSGDDDRYRNDYIRDFYVAGGVRFGTNSPPNTSNFVNSTFDPDQRGSTDQINRQSWMFKYQNGMTENGLGEWNGPNKYCTIPAITELTTTETTVEAAIDAMQANGITNIQQGLTWGWRTLSDNEPFTGGREDGNGRNMKYIILLTDGNNYYPTDGDSTPNLTGYGAWAFARADQNRWIEGLDPTDLAGTIYENTTFDTTPESRSDSEKIMNAHTLQSCNNAKADGISIFTIAFDVSDGSSVKSLLNACAGTGVQEGIEIVKNGEFYYDVDGNDLDEAMSAIAAQIGDLRIIR
ncbi:MAG: pilus assembly protein [Rhizobiaceae bacterium]